MKHTYFVLYIMVNIYGMYVSDLFFLITPKLYSFR